MIYTVFQKSDDILILKNNSVKNEPILVIVSTQNPEKNVISDDYKCVYLTCKM